MCFCRLHSDKQTSELSLSKHVTRNYSLLTNYYSRSNARKPFKYNKATGNNNRK